jgi:hypothetical protein
MRLIEGDAARAKALFEQCVNTNIKHTPAYQAAEAEI